MNMMHAFTNGTAGLKIRTENTNGTAGLKIKDAGLNVRHAASSRPGFFGFVTTPNEYDACIYKWHCRTENPD